MFIKIGPNMEHEISTEKDAHSNRNTDERYDEATDPGRNLNGK